jgi:ArsR family transcriptional regulator
MSVDLELTPKTKRAPGERCCEPVVYPDVDRKQAEQMAQVAKALGDPVRLQLVDVLRKHAGKVCVCELVPLFDLAQPTVSHHLKVLLLRDPRLARRAVDMADLTEPSETVEDRTGRAAAYPAGGASAVCCGPDALATCCEPAAKEDCCGRAGCICGAAVKSSAQMAACAHGM